MLREEMMSTVFVSKLHNCRVKTARHEFGHATKKYDNTLGCISFAICNVQPV